MEPQILISLVGTVVTALATIIVALIQNQSKKKPSPILIPAGYKEHHPKRRMSWMFVLPIALLGGVVTYFSSPWFYSSPPPVIAMASPSLTISPSAANTKEVPPGPLLKDCINTDFWFSLDSQVSEPNCLQLDKWGITAIDGGLSISSTNNSGETIRQGLFMLIERGTRVSLKLTISELYTPTDNNLANLSLGIVSKASFDLERDPLLIYQRESPREGYPILVKKAERGGVESYLLQEGVYRRYTKKTTQDIVLEISDDDQLMIYIDRSPVIQVYVPFQEKAFWIGYRLAANSLVNAEISEFQIQTK